MELERRELGVSSGWGGSQKAGDKVGTGWMAGERATPSQCYLPDLAATLSGSSFVTASTFHLEPCVLPSHSELRFSLHDDPPPHSPESV